VLKPLKYALFYHNFSADAMALVILPRLQLVILTRIRYNGFIWCIGAPPVHAEGSRCLQS
jgi:hypothetical protein